MRYFASLITFSCKLYPQIDKDFFEVMGVKVFDCNVTSNYNSENEKCANSSTNYIQTFSSGIKYACDNNKWRSLNQGENEYGICSNEGDVKKNMYCAKNLGWIKNVGYKTFADNRDKRVYRAIKIGDQIWMAENLNYNVKNSSCYDDDKESCNKYGRLYTWRSIMSENDNGCMNDGSLACFNKGIVQGICPDGWHLPSKKDFEKFISTIEKDNWSVDVKSESGWANDKHGVNTYGFNVYPTGIWCSEGCLNEERREVYFYGKEYSTSFWSSSVESSYSATMLSFCNYNSCIGIGTNNLTNGFSVRCLKDPKPKTDKNDVKKIGTNSGYAKLRAKQSKEKKK